MWAVVVEVASFPSATLVEEASLSVSHADVLDVVVATAMMSSAYVH